MLYHCNSLNDSQEEKGDIDTAKKDINKEEIESIGDSMNENLFICGIVVFVGGMLLISMGYSITNDPLIRLSHEMAGWFDQDDELTDFYEEGIKYEFGGAVVAFFGIIMMLASISYKEEDKEKNKEIVIKQLEKKLGIEELKTPIEMEVSDKLNTITKVIEAYTKKGYRVTKYEFEDPILKVSISNIFSKFQLGNEKSKI